MTHERLIVYEILCIVNVSLFDSDPLRSCGLTPVCSSSLVSTLSLGVERQGFPTSEGWYGRCRVWFVTKIARLEVVWWTRFVKIRPSVLPGGLLRKKSNRGNLNLLNLFFFSVNKEYTVSFDALRSRII